MEFPGENRYIFLGKEMFGFETQSEIVSWQKTGNNWNFMETMDRHLDQLRVFMIRYGSKWIMQS